jgi:para-nitrobenzyl esterase
MFMLAIACAVAGHLSMRTGHTQGSSCFVTTVSGEVQGVDAGLSCAFLGIPFAAPPVGNLRWKPPQPAAPWAPATLNATVAPLACAQLNSATGLPSGSEDCLKLNVWTPNPPGRHPAPVIVWLHPGSFAAASANFPPQNGQSLAARTGTIIVAANYRLGAFGFLGHAALAAEGEGAGNYGLLDQRAALVWVRDHVAAFGGDPHNVTIAGESAGAHSVSLHLVSPGSAGLFHRAIMESGTASFQWRTAAEAELQGTEFATALGCTGTDAPALLACLRSKTRDQVLLARPPPLFEQINETGRTQWTPVVDGYEIPDQPRRLYRRGAFTRVPIMLGANRDEGWTFVNRSFPAAVTLEQYEAVVDTEFGADAARILAAYPAADFASPKHALARLAGDVEYVCEARRVARMISKTRTPVFLYSFEYEVDAVIPDLVPHGFEVNFVFGNNFGPPLFAAYVLNAVDLALSQAIGGYWTRFASTGDPNTPDHDVVRWPEFERSKGHGHARGIKHSRDHGHERGNYIAFGTETNAASHFAGGRCGVWKRSLFRSVTGAVPAATP